MIVGDHAEEASAGAIRASAVAVDVRMREARDATAIDAVRITIAHHRAEPLVILVPYQIVNGRAEFGEPVYRTVSPRDSG